MNKTTNNHLKIIAVNILAGCEPHIKKNLQINKPYLFYNDYVLIDSDNRGRFIVEKDFNKSAVINDTFFVENLSQSTIISISALVGKNGSGKSAIIDIILRLINNLAFKLIPQASTYSNANIKWVKGIKAQLYFSIDNNYYLVEQTSDGPKDISLHYFSNKWIKLSDRKKTLGESFFYTILMNYSLYAFNTWDYEDEWENKENEESCWLNGVFHKNDGYQSPVVLNPERIKGNIEINRENNLAKDRLISLFFNENEKRNSIFTEINDKCTVNSLVITLDKNSVERKFKEIINEWEKDKGENENPGFWKNLRNKIIDEWRTIYHFKPLTTSKDEEYEVATLYLAYKTISIAQTYDNQLENSTCLIPFNSEPWDSKRNDDLKKLITEIDKDESHITFKLRQTLAFLKFRHIKTFKNRQEITINEFAIIATDKIRGRWKYLDFVPAPFFKTDVMLKELTSNEIYPFSKLSSGERQLIYSASGILYHIRNINSIRQNLRRIKYLHLNIILDEIELYFHPEYQRRFVDYLLKCIDSIKFQDVKSINILMATHSPFILSDIPKSNVLFLKEGSSQEGTSETFGSNIHTLYRDNFFIEGMPIGEFAKSRIVLMFDKVKKIQNTDENLYNEIRMIGEPLLRNQLLKLYNQNCAIDLAEKVKKLEDQILYLKSKQ